MTEQLHFSVHVHIRYAVKIMLSKVLRRTENYSAFLFGGPLGRFIIQERKG